MQLIAHWISEVLNNLGNEAVISRVRGEVEALTEKFPLYENRRLTEVGRARPSQAG
jgi:glycine/serine hydroxymethyltransferase